MIIGITSGCFDLLHPLHVLYLEKCKQNCDKLVVGIDTDTLILKNKKKIPVFNQRDRAYMVNSLVFVDEIFYVNNLEEYETKIKNYLKTKHKIVQFKNSSTVYHSKLLNIQNVENIIIPDINIFDSTTSIINYLKQ